MRNFEERKEEIFRRSEAKIAQRKKNIKRVVATCVPLVLCVTALTGYLTLGGSMEKASAPEAPWQEGAMMDAIANGSGIFYDAEGDLQFGFNGAQVPESAPGEYNGAEAPESAPGKQNDAAVRPDHYEEVIELCVGRDYRYFGYNQEYIVDAFLEILEGESYGPAEEDRIRAEKYFSSFDPAKDELLEDDEYIVTLVYPGHTIVNFILRGDRLTRADGVSYHLTQEQATLLHNMAEDNWEWNAPVLSEEQIIDVVKNEVQWNYYAVTAEQDPQSGDWTVTFWSRDCEGYQVFTVSQKGKILLRWGSGPVVEGIEESEAITIAQEHARIDPTDGWEVSAGWNCRGGIWTVTFSDVWIDGYVEVLVRYDGKVLKCTQYE